ncbi:hypothetical protein PP742_gp42 [Alcaligenes phage vB_Af_QDWS595]|uniref:Uncharacterized protein n=1 Tax=Alcaligenes phage vB_Af_QDWS595 TaxID=2877946 RepID=A0AAE9C0I7_9CAUD|nr:hypothetical protein PP742_gp42 [Alcaligenes phage vB_Af_QDWS595]UCR75526.1 hypothetical protein vBAfaPQDWS595_42 [Alcaligenes phage vB_Af_QDWS595]
MTEADFWQQCYLASLHTLSQRTWYKLGKPVSEPADFVELSAQFADHSLTVYTSKFKGNKK